jgi:hypothetical protein
VNVEPLGQLEQASIDRAAVRWMVYGLLMVLSVAGMSARVFAVKSKSGRTPMLSANDRSRWANIRALVDHGTYELDQVVLRPDGRRDPEWYSIDAVKHRGRDGREHFYSSKPTLLATVMAGPYWIVKQVTGKSLAEHSFPVIRILLMVANVLPLLTYFLILAWLAERMGTTDFGRLFVMAAGTFGTCLTTFAVTLNNHLPAAICVLATVAVVLQICWLGKQSFKWFALAGLLAAATAANELPALSFFCLVGAILFWVSRRLTLQAFLPAAGIVAGAAIGTNYLAHGTWSTPYAHRTDGPRLATVTPPIPPSSGTIDPAWHATLESAGISVAADSLIAERPAGKGWSLRDPQSDQRWALRSDGEKVHIHEWNDWYEYDGTYWTPDRKQGVDRGEPSKLVYAFHTLVGHHGVFSLTPLWLASLAGVGLWLRRATTFEQPQALSTLLLTVVCFTFYLLLRPVEDRNYGGVSCCLRWTLWLVPLWLLCLLPAADRMAGRKSLRAVGFALLAVSVFSATYNSLNPWSHPWLFEYWTYLGWIRY